MGNRAILITGATGRQGGATLESLIGKGFHLRAMTRKPDGDRGRALKARGIDVVYGDFDDEASLRKAVDGAWGIYAVQNTREAGVEREEIQGKRIAKIAREAGVEHFVYASVGSAHRRTGVPRFEGKWRIEETVRSLKFPSYAIIRPVFFMENVTSPTYLKDDVLSAALKPSTLLQMIAVEDIGKYGARAFTDAARLNGREIDIAGDARTMPEVAMALERAMGKDVSFMQTSIDDVRRNSIDYAAMLDWLDRVGFSADISGNEREFGIHAITLDTWAATHAKAA